MYTKLPVCPDAFEAKIKLIINFLLSQFLENNFKSINKLLNY